jgi:uncharacterized membrane protein
MAEPVKAFDRGPLKPRADWRLAARSTYLLIAQLGMLFLYPFFLDDSLLHRLVLGLLNMLILVAAAFAASETRRAFLLVVVFLGLPAFGLQVAFFLTNNQLIGDLFYLTYAVLYVITIAHVLRYALQPGDVSADKIHGAIAGYILTAMLWTSIYVFVDHLKPGSFSINGAGSDTHLMTPMDFLYFSFATLTTTGYGDIVPVSAHARSLAILEQLAGTFYIAILIARLTGLYQGRAGRD